MEDNNLQMRTAFFQEAENKLKKLKKMKTLIKRISIPNSILIFIYCIILIIISSVWTSTFYNYSFNTNIITGTTTTTPLIPHLSDYLIGVGILGGLIFISFIINVVFSILAVVKVGQIRDLTEEYFSNPFFNNNQSNDNNMWMQGKFNYSNLSINNNLSTAKIFCILGIFIIPIVMYLVSFHYINKTIDNYQQQIKNLSAM